MSSSEASGTCACGCGEATRGAARWRHGHNGRRVPPPILEDRGHATPCLIWQGSLNTSGYGQRRVGGRLVLVHRVAYEDTHGPIPAGRELDHLCRVRACVNPDHLEAVTRSENVWRGVNARLSREQVRAIRSDARSAAATARAYGVSESAVRAIRTGRRWKQLGPPPKGDGPMT